MADLAKALDLPFDEAIRFLRDKTSVTSEHYTDVWRETNAKMFHVSGAMKKALVDDFKAEIQKALDTGSTLADLNKRFPELVKAYGWEHHGSPGWRARIIYETNLSMAYAAGRYSQLTEPETLEAFPYWQYVHSGSAHPRPEHLGWDGLTLRADDPFWDAHYPPNGWRCGCRVRPVSEGGLRRMGKLQLDKAPVLETYPWTNPKTGEIVHVVKGIDPGFDYNVGKAWASSSMPYPAPAPVSVAAALPLPTPAAPPPAAPSQVKPIRVQGDPNPISRLLTQDFKEWAKSLAPEEIAAITDYKGDKYKVFNAHLRQGGLDFVKGSVNALASALLRAETKQAFVVHRGFRDGLDMKLFEVGKVFRDKGFLSASIDPMKASKFAGMRGHTMEIHIPAGFKGGAYVHTVPRVVHREYEFLFAPETDFKIVRKRGNTIIMEPVSR